MTQAVLVGCGSDEGLGAGGEEGGGEDGAAVEWDAQEGLVGGVDEWRGDGGDGELAERDGAGEEEVWVATEVERDGGDAGAGDEGGEEDAVAGGGEFGEEAGGGTEDVGDESGEGGVAGAGGVPGDVGVVGCVGGDGGGCGVSGLAGEVGGVDEGGAGGVEAFDEAVLEGVVGGGMNDG